jgi:hypothetical protein
MITKTLPSNKIPVNDISKQHHPILKNFFDASKDFNFTLINNLKAQLKIK